MGLQSLKIRWRMLGAWVRCGQATRSARAARTARDYGTTAAGCCCPKNRPGGCPTDLRTMALKALAL